MKLPDRVALVTGAGSGIGAAAAHALAHEGAKVAALGRTEDELRQTVEAINRNGGEAISVIADVSQPNAMQQAVEQVINRWGRLDIVLANAGINGKWAPLEDLTPDDWDKTLNVNLKGTFLTVKYAVPHLKRQGGSVIITSSINGTRVFSNTGASAYSTSKAGQVAFAKMVALELAPHHVRVNVICPGAIKTNIDQSTEKVNVEKVARVEFPEGEVPLTEGQPGTAEQVAQLIVFLASDDSSHITGTEIWIDGGESLLRG
ncbi:MAG: SDR family oxidoreductase [Chloroflexi bacterium]|nr:SDR family oxidoreductase [Chloroflexota bacterium]